MAGLPPTSPTISHPAHTLLSRAHSPTHATNIFTDKVKNKPLLLTSTTGPDQPNPTTTTPSQRTLRRKIRAHKARYQTAKSQRRPHPLSAREKRRLGTHALPPPNEVRYAVYAGLNRLWTAYVLEVLGFTGQDGALLPEAGRRVITAQSHGSLLASADFHGMAVEVVRCADVGRVGLKGIVVRETRGTVVVVTEKDEVRRVLKKGAVFKVEVEIPRQEGREGEARKLIFELHGSQLEVRPAERAVRKFKWKIMDYL